MHQQPVLTSARPTQAARQCALQAHHRTGQRGSEGTERKPVALQSNHRNVGVRGSPPGKHRGPAAKTIEDHQARGAGTWARRDLNPHVLSDTRT